jgi:hypothetical protein
MMVALAPSFSTQDSAARIALADASEASAASKTLRQVSST